MFLLTFNPQIAILPTAQPLQFTGFYRCFLAPEFSIKNIFNIQLDLSAAPNIEVIYSKE